GAGAGRVGAVGRQAESVGPRARAAGEVEHFGAAGESGAVPVKVIAAALDADFHLLQAAAPRVAGGAGDGAEGIDGGGVGRAADGGGRRQDVVSHGIVGAGRS